jgi:miniconductance mechanosensitive channel
MLIFKDTILGFVASMQVSTNDMVRIGDWITMPKYGADGDVIQITLTTVKIRNFDKTITTIPPYSLVSDSFQNWRGMVETGGRRVKRSIYVKQSSIRFLSDEEVKELLKVQAVNQYISTRSQEIEAYNQSVGADKSLALNGRNLTNMGLFREYIKNWLSLHPDVHKEMLLLVRQLQPTSKGLPLELYFFTATTEWERYEDITSDVFDHVTAAARFFDLELFEDISNPVLAAGITPEP